MVKWQLPPAAWVRSETQHLTLAFLGEQPKSLLATLVPLMEAALGGIPRFEARLRGSGFFPNVRHPRVGWIGVTPEDKFHALASAVRGAVEAAGVKLDHTDFRPHLTLFRIRDRWPPDAVELFNNTLRDYESEPIPIDGVTLFSSKLDPKGAIHTSLRTFALA
jgi:2''-5'' RNA ligase